MNSLSHIAFKPYHWGIFIFLISCQSNNSDPYKSLTEGAIDYPFYSSPKKIGYNGSYGKKLVVKSISNNTEYVIEIPNSGEDYNVEIPIAQNTDYSSSRRKKNKIRNPQSTDRELVNQLPKLSYQSVNERLAIEKGMGLGENGGPSQSPSYIVGLSEISDHYRNREFELALIKINNLLIHYPTSAKLYKMKGTIFIKLRNYQLAEKSWSKAVNLDPSDNLLKKGLERVQQKVISLPNNNYSKVPIPAPIRTKTKPTPLPKNYTDSSNTINPNDPEKKPFNSVPVTPN